MQGMIAEHLRIVRHQDLAECLETWFEATGGTFPMEGFDVDGTPYCINREEFFANMTDRGRWGFCLGGRGPAEIHVWLAPDRDTSEMVSLLGHEMGHLSPPWYGGEDMREEAKAGLFDVVARLAHDAAGRLMECPGDELEYIYQSPEDLAATEDQAEE
ncbi:MAG: hypothetical protein KQJ78_07610 [Deltaproteobacteria bacterium]|nr:hypothetical protein [Deltaproteobacteria bacterium]